MWSQGGWAGAVVLPRPPPPQDGPLGPGVRVVGAEMH